LPAVRSLFEGDCRGKRPSAPQSAVGTIVALFKPQFEARKDEVPRGGVIRDLQVHATLIGRFAAWCVSNSFSILDLTASPILGADGNREFFFLLRSPSVILSDDHSRSQDSASSRRDLGRGNPPGATNEVPHA